MTYNNYIQTQYHNEYNDTLGYSLASNVLKISNNVIFKLLNKHWSLEACDTHVQFQRANCSERIDYENIVEIKLDKIRGVLGFFSQSFIITIKSNVVDELTLPAISKYKAKRFEEQARQYAGQHIGQLLQARSPQILTTVAQFDALYAHQCYLNQTRIDFISNALPRQDVELLEHPYFDEQYLPQSLTHFATKYINMRTLGSYATKQRNAKHIEQKQAQYQELFDTLERFPLTDEQREAVISEEDNTLLIAAAGSGKSSTLVAKLLYLLKEGHRPNEIICFAYNKDAQVELKTRIDGLFEKFNWQGERVSAQTFHGFCMEVIRQVTQEKPSISAIATASKRQQLHYFIGLVQELRQSSPSFSMSLLNYFTLFKVHEATKENGDINNQQDYSGYLGTVKGKDTINPTTGQRETALIAMNGVEVKSIEELKIANWLCIHGIKFEYEKQYIHETADADHRQYYPDFYYPDIDLWHEHFALDKDGNAPAFMEDYVAGVKWKRELHKTYNTELIETTSADFTNGDALEKLDKMLTDANAPRTPLQPHQIDSLIDSAFNPSRDLELFITFLKHFKTNNVSLNNIKKKKAGASEDRMRTDAFFKVFEPIYKSYQKNLKAKKEIDFEDLIHQASAYIESGEYQSPYRYLLVDEFQDASQDRLRLIKALRNQTKGSQLLAVGDDWQSIYRFSGADLTVMTDFSSIFGFTNQLRLTQTFRSVQQIVDVASEFVQRNPAQFKKEITALAQASKDPVILRPYHRDYPDDVLSTLLKAINQRATNENTPVSVFILTRYVAQKPTHLHQLKTQYSHLHVEWKTIHASKGLEADYVILHHLNSGVLGFPSQFSDDPLLSLVIPTPESFPYAEERRLLYVALTRAKRGVFGFYDKTAPSIFVKELSKIKGVRIIGESNVHFVAAGQACPQCKLGTLNNKIGRSNLRLTCSKCTFSSVTKCPECKEGNVVRRQSKKTRYWFFACDRFPTCNHIYPLPKT